MVTQLTTQNATITTAAVEVQTLTIGRKQVTLAVFRQLQEEPLIALDGTLCGDLWGRVNYHPDKCADSGEHVHVVWQKDGELRRSAVQPPGDAFHEHPLAGWYVHARVLEGLTESDRGPNVRVFRREPGMGRARAWVSFEGVRLHAPVSDACAAAYDVGRRSASVLQKMRTELATEFSWEAPTSAVLGARLLPIAVAYRESWATIQRLPQLFIAV